MKKNYITLFLALILSTLSFAQNFNAIEPELQTILNQKSVDLVDIQIYFESNINSNRLNQATRQAHSISEKKEFIVNELKTHSENVQADVMAILNAEKLSGNVTDIRNIWIANTISCKASRAVIYNLSSHPDIKIIGYDKEIQLIPSERMEEIKATAKSEARAGGPDAHVQAVEAHRVWWELGYTGKNVVVAVLDSGTNTNHLDLKDHLWTGYVDTNKDGNPDTYVNGWNFIDNNSNITDDYGHGTHCAGIVCGDGTAIVTTGIAPDASLMTVKIVNRAGGGSVTQMLNGVQFAVENGADVLSMSLGFKNNQLTTVQKETIRATFDNVLAAGVVVCAAAGNDGNTYGAPNNVDYPAACPAPWSNPDQTLKGGLSSVICVGAHDLNESSRGPSTWEGTSYNDYAYNNGESMGLIRPDISAPGYIIRSTKYNQNDIYELKSGTSQATPIVAGVIALMLEKNANLTPAQISQIIEETATSKPSTKNNNVGAGIVNALAAVNSITETTPNPFIQVNAFTPKSVSTGNQTIEITFKNKGTAASNENTSVTLSLANDPYVTISNPTQTLGQINSNGTKALNFNLNIDENTPSGHTINFSITTTSGSLSWTETLSVKSLTSPNIALQSVTPTTIDVNTDANINVTLINNGTAALSDSMKLTLSTITNDLKYITFVDNEATIKPLGAGETATATFTVNTNNSTPGNYGFDFFLETYSESTSSNNYIYEFENDMEGWTCFNASGNNAKTTWFQSSNAASQGKEPKHSHSGKGHLMSVTYRDGVAASYNPIDNYLVSPVKIKIAENSKISFFARAHTDAYYKEHFGLAISTTGNASASNFTTVQDWIITDRTNWKEYTFDLSAYAGQEIYIAIRHFFTAQEWSDSGQGLDYDVLNIDDIALSNVVLTTHHIPTYSYDDPYYFRVTTRRNIIESSKVENLVATATSSTEITLTWNAVENATSYSIYQGTSAIATNVTDLTYVVDGLEPNKEYCFNVAAFLSNGSTGYSDYICTTTLEEAHLSAPTNVVAEATSSSAITLTWNTVDGATSYNVCLDKTVVNVTTNTYTIEDLNASTEYCFTVTAVNEDTESETSSKVCVTTKEEAEVPGVDLSKIRFYYDFENYSLEGWRTIDADGDGDCWTLKNGADGGIGDGKGLFSGIPYGGTPENYIVTTSKYTITETSELSFQHVQFDYWYFSEKIAVVISEDGENFERIWQYEYTSAGNWNEAKVDLSAYAGKDYYIGLLHYKTDEGIRVDNIKLHSEIPTTPEPEEPIITTAPVVSAEATSASVITLTWNDVENALSYNVYQGETSIANVTETTFAVENLEAYTDYSFTVSAVRNEQEVMSEPVSAKTLDLTIAAPVITAEATSASVITLTWNAVENALNYVVYQGEDSIANITETTFAVENLEAYTDYSFTVTALRNAQAETSAVVTAKTLDLTIAAPVVTAEATSASVITLTWNAVENAMSYVVYQGEDSIANITETTFTVEGLASYTDYSFTVTALRNAQAETSAVVTAKTLDLVIAAPVVTAEATSASVITLTWNAVENAMSYVVYQGEDSIANITETTFTVEGLASYTDYSFTVTALRNAQAETSAVVTAKTLDLVIAAPVVTAEATSDTTIVLTWNAVENALSYVVYQGEDSIANVTETTFTVEGLDPYTDYSFTVTALRNAQAETSAVVTAKTLDLTIAAPVVTAEATSASVITLTWNAVENALSYNVYQGETSIANVTETTFAVEDLDPYTDYSFTVTALRNAQAETSAVVTAKTLDLTIAAPVVTAEATSDTTIVLSWNVVENAMSYNVYNDTVLVTNVTDTTYNVTGLKAATEYCFAVSAVRNEQETEKVKACATTEAGEPVVPEPTKLAAPTNLRATIRQDVPGFNYKYEITMEWDAVEGAKGYDIFVNTADTTGFQMGYTNGTAYVAGSNKEGVLEFYVVAFNDDPEADSDPSEPYTITIVDDAIEELTSSFNVYPNPVNDKLYVETLTQTQTLTVEIYDIYGRQQSMVNGQQSTVIDVTNLNSGVYFVKVVTENGEAVQRFIKK